MTDRRRLFVLGPHKSGTTLLLRLFDGHSRLHALPTESHALSLSGTWIDYSLRRQLPSAPGFVTKRIAADVRSGELNRASAAFSFAGYDDGKLQEMLAPSAIDSMNPAERTCRILDALAAADPFAPPDWADRMLVEKTVEHLEHAPLLAKYFPDSLFVQITRNPYANLHSLFAYRRSLGPAGRASILRKAASAVYAGFYHLDRNADLLGDALLSVRYEDLVADPGRELRRICEFIGVDFEERLLTPSLGGKAWSSNSVVEPDTTEIVTNRSSAWLRSISPLEVGTVNSLLGKLPASYGYEVLPTPSVWHLLKPIRGERLLAYCSNRSDLWLERRTHACEGDEPSSRVASLS